MILAGGGAHTLAATSMGTVLAWGENCDGQLGNVWPLGKLTPIDVPSPFGSGLHGSAIAAGEAHSLAIDL